MGWLTFWKRDDDTAYEQVFEKLDALIESRTQRLAEIKQREHNGVVLFTSWSMGLWALYVAIWWLGVLTSASSGALERAFYAAPLAVGPILTVFTRRTFHWWYRRKANREDAELKVLRKKKDEQLDKFRKATKVNDYLRVLEKYDEKEKARRVSLASFPVRGSPGRGSVAGTPRGSPTSGRGRGINPALAPAINAQFATPTRGGPQSPMTGSPASRGWVDRFADKILGDDESAPQNKYALICTKCFAHNGLVLKAELATTQYVCPKCGHMNLPKPKTAVGEETPTSVSMPRSRTHSVLSPATQSAVFGRHTHRHSMIDLADSSSTQATLRPQSLPRRPSSAGDAHAFDDDDEVEHHDETRAASEPSRSPVDDPAPSLPAVASSRRRAQDSDDSDGMDEG